MSDLFIDDLTTESSSGENYLIKNEDHSTLQILTEINNRDKEVAQAIEQSIKAIEQFIEAAFLRINLGGRLFYIGSGTSGRLGIVDASECPPTFGVSHNLIIGVIAGGDSAIRKAVEFAEDDLEQGWRDLQNYDITDKDTLLGISASGRTPYVIGALSAARKNGILSGSLSCNKNSIISSIAECPIEIVVGPEFIAGSTRMKAGTAQKMVLNMISTTLMIKLGKVKGDKMIDMQLSNHKLIERGIRMIIDELGLSKEIAKEKLLELGSVRLVLDYYESLKSTENKIS